MTPEELYYAWIDAIVAEGPDGQLESLVNHIMKHATKDLQAYLDEGKDLRLWFAGMINLCEIFRRVAINNEWLSMEDLIGRLQSKAENDPTVVQCPVPRVA